MVDKCHVYSPTRKAADDERWARNYALLADWVNVHGWGNLSRRKGTIDGVNVGNWVAHQREKHRAGELSADRVAALEKIGVVWNFTKPTFEERWKVGFAHAQRWHLEHDDLNVPSGTVVDGFRFYGWLLSVRRAHQKGTLGEQYKAALDALDFDWDSDNDARWNHMFAIARRYRTKHGHLEVPVRALVEGEHLGMWLRDQRSNYHGGNLAKARVNKLNRLRVRWEVLHPHDRFQRGLAAFHAWDSQHPGVPPKESDTIDGFPVGKWSANQRLAYRRGTLSPERVEALDAAGFDWHGDYYWNAAFDKLAALVSEHGGSPPLHVTKNGEVRLWVGQQRRHLAKGTLRPDRVARLDALDYDWRQTGLSPEAR